MSSGAMTLDVRHLERESGDVQDTGADTGRARTELGLNPATTLREGLAAELEWVRERADPIPRVHSLTAS
jgi:UDP-glucuronate 4-epimerase